MQGEQLQLLIENVKDRTVAVPGLQKDALIPLEEPGMESIILRDIQRTIVEVESKIKVPLSPKRKTNLPKTAREAYENKVIYNSYGAFVDETGLNYPTWADLTPEQQTRYGDVQNNYTDGTLPWELMTKAQKLYLSNRVIFAPNKTGPEEKIDGKGRSYIKLYNRQIIEINKIALEIRNPRDMGIPFLSRAYGKNEYYLYAREGAVMLVPMYAQLGMAQGGGIASTAFGLRVPKLPQIITIDYSYGFQEVPLDLMDAVAMKAANRVFETVNILQTQGLMSYSVQGFSASFGKGMYADVMDRYDAHADLIMMNYMYPLITGQ